ncbi:hypothetical protein [Sphaerisporangium rhizosphaerae]|uniref:Uncharacterized protein n=1 Tax=Sphaerisporangium rhizosphaerae TaxID=2269375 RepID=A0ABW2PF49_9ACTN
MNGWAPKLRRSLAAGILGVCAALLLMPPGQGSADTNNYIYTYSCKRKLSDSYETVRVKVAIPRTVRVGEQLALTWTLSDSKLLSPADFKTGSKVSVTGTADVDGLWQGQLNSVGTKDQGELKREQSSLALPTGVSGSVATTKEGKLTVTPRDLVVDLTPPVSQDLINDTETLPIEYTGAWHYSDKADPARSGDHLQDVHWTTAADGKVAVKFTGTGIEYLTERYIDMGEVEVRLDRDSSRPWPKPDASKDENGKPAETRISKKVLWSIHDLPYGEHTLWVINGQDGKYMLVDAFNIITDQLSSPPEYLRTTCTPTETPDPVTVDVVAAAPSDENDGNQHISDGDDSARGVIVLSGGGSGHGAPTETASPTPKASKTSKARSTPQVRVTPRGGAHTGEAPEQDPRPGAFIAYGSVLLLGSVAGGLVLRRRRGRAG